MKRPIDYTINIHGRLLSLAEPQVMGILNATPDSFYSGSRKQTEAEIASRANEIIEQGGTIIDVGAFSTRPGADEVSLDEEMRRQRFALAVVRREQPDAALSVDTYRPEVAKMAVEEFGADIINDVSEGGITGIAFKAIQNSKLPYASHGDLRFKIQNSEDKAQSSKFKVQSSKDSIPAIFQMVARLGVPYILMSVQPTLETMMMAWSREVQQLRDLGVKDIILDPGYGFGKTLEQNYEIMAQQERLLEFGLPLLVGISRKSMIWKLLGGTPLTALNGTSVLNTVALTKGTGILRVHDVREAVEAVKIVKAMNI